MFTKAFFPPFPLQGVKTTELVKDKLHLPSCLLVSHLDLADQTLGFQKPSQLEHSYKSKVQTKLPEALAFSGTPSQLILCDIKPHLEEAQCRLSSLDAQDQVDLPDAKKRSSLHSNLYSPKLVNSRCSPQYQELLSKISCSL